MAPNVGGGRVEGGAVDHVWTLEVAEQANSKGRTSNLVGHWNPAYDPQYNSPVGPV